MTMTYDMVAAEWLEVDGESTARTPSAQPVGDRTPMLVLQLAEAVPPLRRRRPACRPDVLWTSSLLGQDG